MTKSISLLVALWALLSFVILVAAYQLTTTDSATDWKGFSLGAGVGLTFLASIFSAVLSIFSQVQQQKSTEGIELLKYQVSALRKATDALYSAASSYYYTLAQMESGAFDQGQIDNCEKLCVDATGHLKDVPENVNTAWFEYWSRARRVSEDASQGSVNVKEIWAKEAKNVGAALRDLEQKVRIAQSGRA